MRNDLRLLAAFAMLPALAPGLLRAGDASSEVNEAIGSTIVSTYPDGRTGELWLAAGGAYTAEGRRHDRSGGHWKVNGAKLCLKQSRPMPSPFSYCFAIPSGGLADSWTGKAVTGEAIRVHLVKGHVTGEALAERGG